MQEWEDTFKPQFHQARQQTLKQIEKLNSLMEYTSQEANEKINLQCKKIKDTKLGRDLMKYPVVQNITKEDIQEAREIIGEVIGIGSVAYTFIMLFTTWLPGIGIPISAGVAVKALTDIASRYSQMTPEEQKSVQKVCSYIRFVCTGILHL